MSSDDADVVAHPLPADAVEDRSDRPGSDGEHVLQRRFGTADRADAFYDGAMQSTLTERMQSFLRQRWLGVLASMEDGRPRVRPCVGDPGMLRVPDAGTVALPVDRVLGDGPGLDGGPGPGNGPGEEHLSLVTVDWWDTTVGLHVNGAGQVRSRLPDVGNPVPSTGWITLDVDEAYIHCAKHVPALAVDERQPARSADGATVETSPRLSSDVRRFVGSRLLAFLATADAAGETDVSPRVGPAGFVQVLDETTLAWPEYRGNGVHASLGNMYERPAASLLFVDWWSGEAVVQVSGATAIEESVAGAEDLTDVDRTKTWVRMDVETVEVVPDPPLPCLQVEEFDPPWGTDDVEAKKSGYFTT